MILVLLVFLGGVLTIVSPCILPVLPFVFSRAEQPFLKSGLPMLFGMAISFTAIATLAAVGGAWAVHINQYGRIISLVLLTAFALTLLSRRLADLLARPFVAVGNRLIQSDTGPAGEASLAQSLLLGLATGLLWAPCAGPILGLVLTGAAISGPNTHTTLLLFAYAAGAATSLAAAILVGGRVFAALKKSLGAGEWIRRGLGVAVLVAVAAIVLSVAAIVGVYDLHLMTVQLDTVGQRLGTLDEMNRKLDGVTKMEARLDAVDGRLIAMETILERTNGKLEGMDAQLRGLTGDMRGLDADLRSMRNDVHTVAHKIDGSFLFRSVK